MTKFRVYYRMNKSTKQVVRSLWMGENAKKVFLARLKENGRIVVSIESVTK